MKATHFDELKMIMKVIGIYYDDLYVFTRCVLLYGDYDDFISSYVSLLLQHAYFPMNICDIGLLWKLAYTFIYSVHITWYWPMYSYVG